MSLTVTYAGGSVAGVRSPSGGAKAFALTESAEKGQASISGLDMEDEGSAFNWVGLGDIHADESDATPTRLWTGYVGDRHIGRGMSLLTGADRVWSVELVDLNARLGDQIIVKGKRPQETDLARIAWMVSAGYAPFTSATDLMDRTGPQTMLACDYTGRMPMDVLADCSDQTGKNYYLAWYNNQIQLGYHPTIWAGRTATISISNEPGAADGSTVFAPGSADILTRSPARVYSGVWLEYTGGAIHRIRAATAAAFRTRETHATHLTIGKISSANTYATNWLANCANEEDRIEIHLERVPAAAVNKALPGQRILCTFQEIEQYVSGTYMAIVSRTIEPHQERGFYRVTLACAIPVLTGFLGPGSKQPTALNPAPTSVNVGVAMVSAASGQNGAGVVNPQMQLAQAGALTPGSSSDDESGVTDTLPYFKTWSS